MKAVFLCKRGRPDIATVVALLSTRVRESTEDNQMILTKMILVLKSTEEELLSLEVDDSQ